MVSESCYSKQKCAVTVGNQTFRDPCFPGTRKYLSVLYSCGGSLLCFLILKLLSWSWGETFKIKAHSHDVMIGLRHPSFCFGLFFPLIVGSDEKSYLQVPAALFPSHPKTYQQAVILTFTETGGGKTLLTLAVLALFRAQQCANLLGRVILIPEWVFLIWDSIVDPFWTWGAHTNWLFLLPTVPQTLLKEADPSFLSSTPFPSTKKGNIAFLFSCFTANVLRFVSSADLGEPSSKGSGRPENSGAMMSNSLLTYTYIRGKTFTWNFTSCACGKNKPACRPLNLHRAPRNGGSALHVQRVRRSSLYAAGSVGARDLQRATAQRSPGHNKQAWKPGCLLWRQWGWRRKGRWNHHRGFFTLRCRKDGHKQLGGRDLCEWSSWTGWEDRTARDDHSRDLDELLPERQLLLIPISSGYSTACYGFTP